MPPRALIVASDVLYEHGPEDSQALARTIRELVRPGGCHLIAISWTERTGQEHRLLEGSSLDIRGSPRGRVAPSAQWRGDSVTKLGLLWCDAACTRLRQRRSILLVCMHCDLQRDRPSEEAS